MNRTLVSLFSRCALPAAPVPPLSALPAPHPATPVSLADSPVPLAATPWSVTLGRGPTQPIAVGGDRLNTASLDEAEATFSADVLARPAERRDKS